MAVDVIDAAIAQPAAPRLRIARIPFTVGAKPVVVELPTDLTPGEERAILRAMTQLFDQLEAQRSPASRLLLPR